MPHKVVMLFKHQKTKLMDGWKISPEGGATGKVGVVISDILYITANVELFILRYQSKKLEIWPEGGAKD